MLALEARSMALKRTKAETQPASQCLRSTPLHRSTQRNQASLHTLTKTGSDVSVLDAPSVAMDTHHQRWWKHSAERRALERLEWLNGFPGAYERLSPFMSLIQATAGVREAERRSTIAEFDAHVALMARQQLLLFWRGGTAVQHRTDREWEELAGINFRLKTFPRPRGLVCSTRFESMMERIEFHRRLRRTDERVRELRSVLDQTKLSAADDVIECIVKLVTTESDLQVDARYGDGDSESDTPNYPKGHVARLRGILAADIARAQEAMTLAIELYRGISDGTMPLARARALLRAGAGLGFPLEHCCVIDFGRWIDQRPVLTSTTVQVMVRQLDLRYGEALVGSAAHLVLCASRPWSPETHELLPAWQQAQVVSLFMLCCLIGQALDVKIPAQVWVENVLPRIVQRFGSHGFLTRPQHAPWERRSIWAAG